MRRWFDEPNKEIYAEGDFGRWNLDLEQASEPNEFLRELGRRVIVTYINPLEYLRGGDVMISLDVTRFAERLLSSDGSPPDTFVTFTGEVLAAWADESLERRRVGLPPSAHQNIPSFDAINIGRDATGIYICLIQAKTTRDNVSGEANLAARQLGRLEKGEFQHELAAALEQIATGLDNPSERRSLMTCLLNSSRRRYAILVIHEIERPERLLTNYDRHIPGPTEKRSAGFIQFGRWDEYWQLVGDTARAEAARRSS